MATTIMLASVLINTNGIITKPNLFPQAKAIGLHNVQSSSFFSIFLKIYMALMSFLLPYLVVM